MMTEEQALALPKKAANRAEVDSYYLLDAFYHELDRIERDMEKRAKLVPGGWRDMRLMKSKLANLLLGLGGGPSNLKKHGRSSAWARACA